LCVTLRPVYDALLVLFLGPGKFLFGYVDDVCMEVPNLVAVELSEALGLHAMVGLRLGSGPKKT
jgi:hypothetical protein